MKIRHLRVNHLEKPLGYDFNVLTLSWEVEAEQTDRVSEVRVCISKQKSMEMPVYDSGSDVQKDFDKCQLSVELPLEARTRYYWKVMIKDTTQDECISECSWFETGKQNEPWKAKWITAEESEGMPWFYKDFQVKEAVAKARLYMYGAGLYEVYMNDKKAGDEYLMPGYHSYDMMMEYQTFDVTELLQEGTNRIGVLLGDGWYKGRFGFDGDYYNLYGDKRKCIAELILVYESGETEWICTDKSWRAETSTIGANGIYDGEEQDANAERKPLEVEVLADTRELLVERSNPPIRKVEEFVPVSECMHEEGYLLLDFGEAITGWVEFFGKLEKGQKVFLQYGEILQNGAFYRDNLRTAKAEFSYISDGTDKLVRPHFTYYGFRYVKVEGLQNGQSLNFRAYRLMSDIEQTGWIETSNEKVNKLFENTIRSQKCNFLDIPTDCPQRDERMGWTGDVNIFAPTACFHMDCKTFFRHYAKSLYQEQKLMGGAVPFFVPRPKVSHEEHTNPFYLDGGACVWGDVAAMLPWTLYQYYGDKMLLEEQYPMMKLWVEYVRGRVEENKVPYLWQNDRHLGDWLALDNGNIRNPIGKTDPQFLASAYHYWSVLVTSQAARVLEYSEAEEYSRLSEKIKTAFIEYYFDAGGKMKTEVTQTACALALHLGLYPQDTQENLAAELKKQIDDNGGKLNTGFVGTPVLALALSEHGMNELAYSLLLNEEYPGWLNEVNMGATTVWERWNSLEKNGVISGTGMNSLNHYAYGSIANWMYRYMCGFCPDMSEDIMMTICPKVDDRLQFVKGRWKTVYGTFVSEWYYDNEGKITYQIEIPFNAKARVVLPDTSERILEHGSYRFNAEGEML